MFSLTNWAVRGKCRSISHVYLVARYSTAIALERGNLARFSVMSKDDCLAQVDLVAPRAIIDPPTSEATLSSVGPDRDKRTQNLGKYLRVTFPSIVLLCYL
jgi:hypothetical protein